MLKLTLLASLAVVALGSTNHYIDYLYTTSLTSGTLFPYPVDLCNRVSLLYQSYKKFVCSSDKLSISVSSYSDSTCTTQIGNTSIESTQPVDKGYGSWSCSGDNYYSSVEVYFGACSSTPAATSNYATDVCYLSSNGNYSIARCTDDEATIKTYSSSSTDCSGSVISTLTAETECSLFTTIGGFSVYAKLTSCEADAAYIPSVMGIIVFLVFNIVYLL